MRGALATVDRGPRGDADSGEGLAGPLATIDRADGRVQVTYAGRPLYLYSLDTGPDMTKGNGLVDESGTIRMTWRVAQLNRFDA